MHRDQQNTVLSERLPRRCQDRLWPVRIRRGHRVPDPVEVEISCDTSVLADIGSPEIALEIAQQCGRDTPHLFCACRAICAREPDIAERYKRGKAKAIAHVANELLQKARADCKTSSIFYLKTEAGWRETAELHHTADASGLKSLSDEELRARAVTARDRIETMLANVSAAQSTIDGSAEGI